jgi:hypothetical protein
MRKLLLAAAAVALTGGVAIDQAHAWGWQPQAFVGIQGGSTSIGAGASQSGGATTTSSGTTYGGSGSNSVKSGNFESNGPHLADGGFKSSHSFGSVSGSTRQSSSTNGSAISGSYSTSGVTVCAGAMGCN